MPWWAMPCALAWPMASGSRALPCSPGGLSASLQTHAKLIRLSFGMQVSHQKMKAHVGQDRRMGAWGLGGR